MNKTLQILLLIFGVSGFTLSAYNDELGIRERILESVKKQHANANTFPEELYDDDFTTELNKPVKLSLSSENVTVNEKFCVQLKAEDFQDVLGMQFSIQYDPNVLEFVDVDNFGLEGISLSSFGLPSPDSEMPSGNITFVWVEPALNSKTLNPGDGIFDICFVAKSAAKTKISFSTSPTNIEVTNSQLEVMNFEGVDADVVAQDPLGNTAQTENGDVLIALSNQKVSPNESFCIDVTAEEFINMLSMQYSIAYDPNMLTLNGVSGFNLPGLSNASFGLPGSSEDLLPGMITVSWFSPTLEPVTIMNDISMFQLCFTAKGEGVTGVNFVETPTSIEFINSEEQQVGHTTTDAIVEIGNTEGGSGERLDGFTLTATSQSVEPGDDFCVSVSVTNFNEIIGMQFSINYDPNALEFTSVGNFNLSGLSAGVFGTPTGGTAPGVVTLVWVEPSLSPVTLADETVIFDVCFMAKTESTTNVTFSNTPTAIEITNGNEENVPFTGVDGEVIVGSGGNGNGGNGNGGGNGFEGFTLEMEDQTLNSGDEFCIPVKVHNFENIIGMQLSINYDPNALEFSAVQNFNLSGLSAGTFGTPASGTSPGVITLVWVEPALSPVTLDDGTAIFEICFTPRSANSTTEVTFTSTPTNIEITNGNEENVPFNGVDATVNLGGDIPLEGFILTVGDATIKSGTEFCVPVTVNDFENIIGMQFSINYDPAELQFNSVANFNLAGLSEGTFGTPSSGTAPGNITLVWVEPSLNAVTLADGTAIFDVCFTAIGNTGTTTEVVFSNTPTNIEITDGNEESVDFNGQPGTIIIDDNAIGEGAVTLNIEDLETPGGVEFCADVFTRDFNNLVGLQLSIGFDEAELEFSRIANLNLSGLTTNQFATPTNNRITLAWVDPVLAGVTVADSTAIFSVCFNAIGDPGTTNIAFTDNPTAIEVSQKDGSSERNVDLVPIDGVITITDVQAPTIVNPALVTNVQCAGESIGAIDIEVQGGTGNYAYQWDFNNLTSQDINGIPAGSYSVTVTDMGSGLTTTETYNVSEPANPLLIANIDVSDVSCNGDQDGTITVTSNGGTGNLIYSWNLGLPNGPTQNNLIAANAYQVTVTDANGCTAVSAPISVGEPNRLRAEFSVTDEQCVDAGDGSITVNANGGTPDYTFDWAGNLTDNQNEQTGLTSGTYSVTVTDANNCTVSLDNIEISAGNAVAIADVSTTDISNGTGGSINLSVSGGSGSYTYNWQGPGGVNTNSEDISGLSVSGDYCVTVTDVSGCTVEDCITVFDALTFGSVTIDNACIGSSNGEITLEIQGGLAPYAYNWEDGTTTRNLNSLGSGSYSVTITDERGRDLRGTFEVGEFDGIVVNESLVQVTGNPDAPTGRINLDISGGNPGYTVQWDNGATGQILENIPVGTYCVTVTDQNGCTFEACYDLDFQPLPLEVAPRFDNVSCEGMGDGALFLIIQGGVTPYEIEFSDGDMQTNTNGLVNKTNLGGGTIGYSVTDAAGATIDGTVTIMEFDSISINAVNIVHDTDADGCSGSISLDLQGGAPGVTVEWNAPNTGRTIINLCEGEYIPTITDGNGCSIMGDPIVLNTFSVDAEITSASCQDSQDGTIQLQVAGGQAPYTFEWRNSQGQLVSRDENPGTLVSGEYTVSVSENSGNVIVREYEIGSDSDIGVSTEVLSNFNGFDVSCANATDGEVRAVPSGGDGNYSFEWTLGNMMVGTQGTLNNAAPGDYELVVIDGNNCSSTVNFTLTAPVGLNVNGSTRDVSCNGEDDGEIVVIGSGGSNSTITYTWDDGSNGSRRSFLQSGDYTVTVEDENNCSEVVTYTISDPEPIVVEVNSVAADDGCNGMLTALVSGGTGPFTYKWNVPGSPDDSNISNLCPGEYLLEVTDVNGCTSAESPLTVTVKDRRFPCFDSRVVITPDGDGLNEEFLINCIDDFATNTLFIYNRWGQLVFSMESYDNSWDGRTSSGEELPAGPYYYVLDYTDFDGNPFQVRGSISVLRE